MDPSHAVDPALEAFMESLQEGMRVRALWDYTATSENELTLEEDDVITLTGAKDGGWLEGELNGVVGFFPANYCEVVRDDVDYDYSNHRQTLYDIEEQVGLTDKLENGISAERNRTWYISYKQQAVQEQAQAQAAEAQEKPSSGSKLTLSAPKALLAEMPRPKKWTDDVDGMILSRLSDKEKKRQEVIFELIQTERDYLRDLDYIIESYLIPIRERKILTAKDTMVIFSIVEMLVPVNQELLRNLEERRKKYPVLHQVGDIMLHVADYFKIYNMYCSNHPFALMKIQNVQSKQFRSFIQEVHARPESRNLDLGSYLIKPVQRICKYPLLVKEIIKHTEPTHADYHDLQEALERINMVVTVVNEATRNAEMVDKMLQIQSKLSEKVQLVTPARKLLRDETVALIKDGKRKEKRRYLLFNDLLVITKPAKMSGDKLVLVRIMPLDEIAVTSVDETTFNVAHGDKPALGIVAPDEQTRIAWQQELQQLHEDEKAHKEQEREYATHDIDLSESGMSLEAPAPSSPQINKSAEKALKKAQKEEEKRLAAERKAEEKAAKERAKAEAKAQKEREAAEKARIAQEEKRQKEEAKQLARQSRSMSTSAINPTPPPPPASAPPSRRSLESPRGSSTVVQRTDASSHRPSPPSPLSERRDRSSSATASSSHRRQHSANERSPPESGLLEFQKVELRRFSSEGGARPASPKGHSAQRSSASDTRSSGLSDPLGSPDDRRSSWFAGLWSRTAESPPQLFGRRSDIETDDGGEHPESTSSSSLQTGKELPPLPRQSYAGRPVPAAPTRPPPSNPDKAANAVARQSAISQFFVISAAVRDHLKPEPNKGYVFVVEVTTDDGRHYKVTKSYDDFYAFHTALIKQYPEEAGLTGKRRTLPDLPVQAIHVTESFAVVQQRDFDRYVKALFRMPEKVCRTAFVTGFFRPSPRTTTLPQTPAANRGAAGRAPAAAAAASSSNSGSSSRSTATTSKPAAGVASRWGGGGGSAASGSSSSISQSKPVPVNASARYNSPSSNPVPRPSSTVAESAAKWESVSSTTLASGSAAKPSKTTPVLNNEMRSMSGKVANSPFLAAAGPTHAMRKPLAPAPPKRPPPSRR